MELECDGDNPKWAGVELERGFVSEEWRSEGVSLKEYLMAGVELEWSSYLADPVLVYILLSFTIALYDIVYIDIYKAVDKL